MPKKFKVDLSRTDVWGTRSFPMLTELRSMPQVKCKIPSRTRNWWLNFPDLISKAKQTVISIWKIDLKPDELVYRPLIPLLQMFWHKLLLNMFSNQFLSQKILFYIAAAMMQVKKKYKGFEAPVVSIIIMKLKCLYLFIIMAKQL